MTQTASFKDKLKTGWAVFKWEVRNCKSPLIVFAILAGVFIVVPLVLSLSVGFQSAISEKEFDYGHVLTALKVFQMVSSYAVFALNAVFTIIYTIKIYSYLHNKRKADMYGAMPVSRRTFYLAKTFSAFAISVLPTMFFFSLIAIISVCFGQMMVNETAEMYVKLLLGSISCISLYSLLAVCCGTTVNAVLSFVAINIAYPVATLFIKGIINAFYIGLNANLFNQSVVLRALCPLDAYNGHNVIYWLLFTAACIFLGTLLVKKRRAESAQTSFAYYLPCYAVKLLVAFIVGMFMGVMFGSLNVFGAILDIDMGFASFVFGFVVGSIPAYLITHIILYKGVSKILKTAIPYAAMVVLVVGAMAFVSFDVTGYTTRIPELDDIASAGLIETDSCYYYGKVSNSRLLRDMADDYTDDYNIYSIRSFHSSYVNAIGKRSNEKFGRVWINMVTSNFPTESWNGGYGISYKLKNGSTFTRLYPGSYYDFSGNGLSYADKQIADDIVDTDAYYENYSSAMQAEPKNIISLQISLGGRKIELKNGRDDDKIRDVLEAFRKDYAEKGRSKTTDNLMNVYLKPESAPLDQDSFYGALFSSIMTGYNSYYGSDPLDRCAIGKDYTNTIRAMIDDDLIEKFGDSYRVKEKSSKQ